MAVLLLERTVGRLRQWAEPAVADAELLQRFAAERDEAAFAELVRRHGGLVLGVARRVTGDPHLAEDVLQSTFLLLARKANAVGWHGSIAPWLHAAGYRLARDARRRQARQPAALGETAIPAAEAPPDRPLLWDEVRAAVDEELARLPAALSAPLLLCNLQGQTRDEAAQRLGWTLATLKRRLERGRRRLRDRLARRGLSSLPMLALPAAEQSLPADLVRNVVRSAGQPGSLLGGKFRKLAAIAVVLATGLCGGWFALRPAPRALPADPPPAKPVPRLDLLGDPLPDGAVARLGTVRLRPGL
ncbi:MAG: RNA polymerase sigma factor, partial [Gemmataceae bacterium]